MERGLLDCSRGRGKRCAASVVGVGNICDLPDSILSHILSFLPTKDAVATSILSHRWKYMWPMTNNLYFVCNDDDDDVVDRFVEFANYVLLLHNPGFLNGFTLRWRTECKPFYVNAWISTAISRNVRKLKLFVGISEFPIHVQRSMFGSESLQSLELSVNYAFCITQQIDFSLPKLESLKLEPVVFESEETLCKLLGGCPVLKDLYLTIEMGETKEKCNLDDGIVFRCIISSASLRRLVLFFDDEDRNYHYISICGVQLDAPSLQYIKLDRISSISIRQTPIFLVKAHIQLFEPDFEEQDHYNSVVEAFRAFDCAKELVLNFEVITAFKSATIEMKSIFNKLTRLKVWKCSTNWIDLHYFLHFSDNLEVFIVDKKWYDCSGKGAKVIGAEPNLVPRCLSNSLSLVSIAGYDGDEDEFAMISYILKHSNVLQLMKLPDFCEFCNAENERELIQKLPRMSPICDIKFS